MPPVLAADYCLRVQAYMVRLGTFGFSDMKGLIGTLNRFAPAPSRAMLCPLSL